MNILERIQEIVKEYHNEHGKKPSKVYLTLEDEIELTGLGKEKLGGKIVSQIIVDGARKNTSHYLWYDCTLGFTENSCRVKSTPNHTVFLVSGIYIVM